MSARKAYISKYGDASASNPSSASFSATTAIASTRQRLTTVVHDDTVEGWDPLPLIEVEDPEFRNPVTSTSTTSKFKPIQPNQRTSSAADLSPPRGSGSRDLSPPRPKKVRTHPQATAEKIEGKTGTIYRDTSGRIVDVRAEKEQMAAEVRKQQMAVQLQKEQAKGSVQRLAREAEKKRLQEMAQKPFARFANDEELNSRLKQRAHWDDPLRKDVGASQQRSSGAGKSSSKVYQGPPGPPNRFNIRPGYRWDGVDRSTGFESRWFRAQAQRAHQQYESYKWGAEDM